VCVPLIIIGVVFVIQARNTVDQQMRSHLVSSAALGADLFSGEELDKIQTPEDMKSALYKSLVERMGYIMDSDESIYSVYLMRRTNDPMTLEFIADAESLLPFDEMDVNGDGVLDETERMPFPGETYDVTEVPVMQNKAFQHPSVDDGFTRDQWGFYISSYAPIFRSNGSVAGIVGIDVLADDYIDVLNSAFPGMIILLVIALGLFIALLVSTAIWRRRVAAHKQIENERTSLLQLVMHQLGEPITILKWSLESISAGCDAQEQKMHTKQMTQAVSWLQSIFDGFMKADKVREQAFSYQPEPVGILSVCNAIKEELSEKLKKRHQTLLIAVPKNLSLLFNKQLMEGVLLELVSNASSFSAEKKTIQIRAEKDGKRIRIEVEDQGCGVPKKEQERVFERFVRGSNASTHKTTGNGLGLYIVRTIVQRAGGKVWLKSTEGKGTIVFIEMPIRGRINSY